MIIVAWIVCALGLTVGIFLGARGLIDPHWAAKLVRLQPDAQGGGFAEFRATYGGVFLGLHAVSLMFVGYYLLTGHPVMGVAATGAVAALSAGWFGAAFGRVVSIWRDKTDTPFNRLSAGVETGLGVAIALPWLAWILS